MAPSIILDDHDGDQNSVYQNYQYENDSFGHLGTFTKSSDMNIPYIDEDAMNEDLNLDGEEGPSVIVEPYE